MTKLKSMLLGTAGAAFVLASGSAAFAADPPAAGPVYKDRTPVWACDITGFWELPGTDICFKVGGYAKADFIATLDNFDDGAELSFDVPVMLLSQATGARLTDGDKVRIHANQSRINFDARSNTEYGVVRAFIEADFFNTAGTERISNSNRLRLRHAFVQFGNLLAGQTWSTFMATFALPDTLDFAGPGGLTFIRQAQFRWTQSFGNGFSVAIAVENPEPAFAVGGPALVGLTATDEDERFPDLVIALKVSQEWGTVQLAGVGREVRGLDNVTASSEFGWAVSLAGRINLPIANGKDNLRFNAIYSDGGNRYLLDANLTVGDAYDPDPVVNPANSIEMFESFGVSAALQHFWSDNLRSTIVGSVVDNDIPGAIATLTPTLIERTYYAAVNLIWSPVPRVDMGVEVLYGKVETVGNAATPSTDADAVRVQASISRSF